MSSSRLADFPRSGHTKAGSYLYQHIKIEPKDSANTPLSEMSAREELLRLLSDNECISVGGVLENLQTPGLIELKNCETNRSTISLCGISANISSLLNGGCKPSNKVEPGIFCWVGQSSSRGSWASAISRISAICSLA
jgi:hypothetical protein